VDKRDTFRYIISNDKVTVQSFCTVGLDNERINKETHYVLWICLHSLTREKRIGIFQEVLEFLHFRKSIPNVSLRIYLTGRNAQKYRFWWRHSDYSTKYPKLYWNGSIILHL